MKTTKDIKVDLSYEKSPLKQKTTKDVEVKYIDSKERVGSKILVSTHDIEKFVKETNKRKRMEKARAAKGKKIDAHYVGGEPKMEICDIEEVAKGKKK